MKLKIETYASIPCELKKFRINDRAAELADFGKVNFAGALICTVAGFNAKPKRDGILKKYCISAVEYDEIVNQLKEKFSFGRCDYCEH